MPTIPSWLFICLTRMQPWLLTKKNSCLLDVQEFISSSMLKLNSDKLEFIIFVCHAQLKKKAPYLPVRIFDNLMHPVVLVKNLGVWCDANCSVSKTYLLGWSQNVKKNTHRLSIRYNYPDKRFLEVPQFCPQIQKTLWPQRCF